MMRRVNDWRFRSAIIAIVSLAVTLLVEIPGACLATTLANGSTANSVQTVHAASFTDTFERLPQGIVRPAQRATMSAPLQGMLVRILVHDGDEVKQDQILAMMDDRVVRASVTAARAEAECTAAIDHARHALALADSYLKRHAALHAAQAGAEFELEQAQAERDQAAAMLASARESQVQATRNLQLEEARLESHNVRAPFDGCIVQIHATPGTTLSPTDELLTIVCLDVLQAEIHVPLELFGVLRPGQVYRLWGFPPVNRLIDARLTFTSPMVDPAAKSFRCVFAIDNQDRSLPAGFSVCLDPSFSPPDQEALP
jgi:HlyD family secretion protein